LSYIHNYYRKLSSQESVGRNGLQNQGEIIKLLAKS
jgi:hypothetical protein